MRILHTADLHLQNEGDDRWNALKTIVQVAGNENVNLFIISGDLFDSGVDAESLRPGIRGIFSDTGFDTIVIPGNHDRDSYGEGLYFGDEVTILSNTTPLERYEGVRIIGLPFEQITSRELLARIRSLKEVLTPERKNILLYHGELLDVFFSRDDFGDEGTGRYMPLKLSYLEGLNIDYVLAGHFHSKFLVRKIENGGYFVYSGSPISITRRETGRRKVNIFDVGSPPEDYNIDTPHFEEVSITLDPTDEENPLTTVKKKLSDLHPLSRIILTIDGAINGEKFGMTEKEFRSLLGETTRSISIVEENFKLRDIRDILEDDLFKAFEEKLASYPEDQRKELRDIAIRAMLTD
ncbi:serine/threonine protein phosphatase [candidate division WOR-3 bacterium JGI_Cruoil_03_44_89]|uniref:Serine/threonine protein phosphatase n=1 Tax=candidate division WOR-3 bacterium JGI_Cruoil_03_44_89 TaxID=1973748 RepID=A0A235BNG9_UNCW3|nr:MAG: serine/threonine protein phosphatase [candidate division WOR-3 bacterium JGI_Cruoil_03_44_89]